MAKASLFFYVVAIFALFSCTSTKEVTYFNTVKDADIEAALEYLEPVIQRNDLLSIVITSINPEAAEVFNKQEATANLVPGYLVAQDGTIQLPMLGTLNVAGLTKARVKEIISESLVTKKLLMDPVVEVRFLNFKITVLGEVGRPSVVTVQNEKISLLEAIGMAGDLTIQAKRNNVLVIRETEGKKTTKRLDLTSPALLTSPYYYLRSNDVVYVEANKSKVYSSSKTASILPLVISVLTFGLFAADKIK